MIHHERIMQASESISMFCRLNLNTKSDLPIRSSEMGLLIYIKQKDAHATSLGASHFFKVSKPMIATMVRVLSKKGYITKTSSPKDKRSFYLTITEQGNNLVENAIDEYSKVIITLMDKMGQDDFTQLVKLINDANRYIGEI